MNHFAVHLKLTQHCKSTILQFKKKKKKLALLLLRRTVMARMSKVGKHKGMWGGQREHSMGTWIGGKTKSQT